jgi:antitoxin HigA-1
MIHKPKHPGIMVKNLCLDQLNLSISEAAKLLKISRPTLSKLVNGHLNISPEMAIRLSVVFNTSEELWINLQSGYDLWKAQKIRQKLHLHPFVLQTTANV